MITIVQHNRLLGLVSPGTDRIPDRVLVAWQGSKQCAGVDCHSAEGLKEAR